MQVVYLLQLYMAPVTNCQRYHDSIYFWRDVYGIKSELNSPILSWLSYLFVICITLAVVFL